MSNRLLAVIAGMTLLSGTERVAGLVSPPQAETPRAQQAGTTTSNPDARANTEGDGQSPQPSEPAYHKEPPSTPLPATLDPAFFREDKAAFVAYSISRRIRELLYQEPCYCPCDKTAGHRSLLDCYTGRHGAICRLCQMEVFLIFEQSRVGRSVEQIRESMKKGDHWKIDVDRYAEAHYLEYAQTTPEGRGGPK
jgi:hypothetical protein